jgi:hypothetical protein
VANSLGGTSVTNSTFFTFILYEGLKIIFICFKNRSDVHIYSFSPRHTSYHIGDDDDDDDGNNSLFILNTWGLLLGMVFSVSHFIRSFYNAMLNIGLLGFWTSLHLLTHCGPVTQICVFCVFALQL